MSSSEGEPCRQPLQLKRMKTRTKGSRRMESSIQIEERAAAWLAKRDSESWSVADEEAFQSWLGAATANRVAYLRLEAAWQAAGRLQVYAAGTQPASERSHRPFSEDAAVAVTGERHRIHHPYRALAASLLIMIAAGV